MISRICDDDTAWCYVVSLGKILCCMTAQHSWDGRRSILLLCCQNCCRVDKTEKLVAGTTANLTERIGTGVWFCFRVFLLFAFAWRSYKASSYKAAGGFGIRVFFSDANALARRDTMGRTIQAWRRTGSTSRDVFLSLAGIRCSPSTPCSCSLTSYPGRN